MRCKCGIRFDSVTGIPEGASEIDWRDEPITTPRINQTEQSNLFDFNAGNQPDVIAGNSFDFGQPRPYGLMECPTCEHEVSIRAIVCPGCGEPLAARGITRSGRTVSGLWTFVFGFFYFAYKGWWKSALAFCALCFFTGFFALLIVPFTAQRFVDAIER
ncbi:MAG: DUF2628 domain-containing protein [Gemmataceae bacterium]